MFSGGIDYTKKIWFSLLVVMAAASLAACGVKIITSSDPAVAATIFSIVIPTETPVPASPVPQGTPVFNLDGTLPPPLDCTVTWTNGVERTFYFEPSATSGVFATTSGGGEAQAVALSDDWAGFEPGVAQAGNAGFRRLRWVKLSDTVTLSGADCAVLLDYPYGFGG